MIPGLAHLMDPPPLHRLTPRHSDASYQNLMSVGGAGLLAGDAPDGVHVVIAHVGTVGGLVFGTAGKGQVLAKGDGDVTEDGEQGAEPDNGLPRGHFVDLLDPHRSSAAFHAVRGTVESRAGAEGGGLVKDAHEAGESAVHLCKFLFLWCRCCCTHAYIVDHTNRGNEETMKGERLGRCTTCI